MLALVLFAVVVRAKVMSAETHPFQHDVDNYRELAESLRHGTFGLREKPTAYRPPLYPLLLAPLTWRGHLDAGAVAFAHVACGITTVWLVAVLGRMWGLGRWRFLAGALVAVDPILLRQSTQLMTETVAAFFAALVLAMLTAVAARPVALRAASAGVALGLAVLCRPTFMPFGLLAPIALWNLLPVSAPRGRCVLTVWLAMAATLAPWAVRNTLVFGRPIVTTTHGGTTFLLGNNPSFYAHMLESPDEPWDASLFNTQHGHFWNRPFPVDELADNEDSYAEAMRSIREEPRTFIRSVLYRVSRLWGVLPLPLADDSPRDKQMRYAVAGWYTLEFAAAILGIWRIGRRWLTTSWIFALLLAAAFTAVHALYWTDLRMRAPLVPAIALVAAVGLSWIAGQVVRRKAK